MADVYVAIGKINAERGIAENHGKAAIAGVHKALEAWIRKTPGYTNATSPKGFHVNGTVTSLDVNVNGHGVTVKSKEQLRVTHLPDIVRPKALLDAGATVTGAAARVEKEISWCTESVTASIASGKMQAYMKDNKNKL
jgi:hypothetical protein